MCNKEKVKIKLKEKFSSGEYWVVSIIVYSIGSLIACGIFEKNNLLEGMLFFFISRTFADFLICVSFAMTDGKKGIRRYLPRYGIPLLFGGPLAIIMYFSLVKK